MKLHELDTSDEATGLPPLDQVLPDESLVVLSWAIGAEGLVSMSADGEVNDHPVRYLSLRGMAHDGECAQIHLGIPSASMRDLLVEWLEVLDDQFEQSLQLRGDLPWSREELADLHFDELLIVASTEGWEIPEELIEEEDSAKIIEHVWPH